MLANASNSRFLNLPREIRDHIYSYVLGGQALHVNYREGNFNCPDRSIRSVETSCTICECDTSEEEIARSIKAAADTDSSTVNFCHEYRHRDCGIPDDEHLSVSLLQTCRKIYSETAYLPFILNRFIFREGNVFDSFMSKLVTQQHGAIETATFTYKCLSDYDDSYCNRLTGLCKIVIFCEQMHRVPLVTPKQQVWVALDRLQQAPIESAIICATFEHLSRRSSPEPAEVETERNTVEYVKAWACRAETMLLETSDYSRIPRLELIGSIVEAKRKRLEWFGV